MVSYQGPVRPLVSGGLPAQKNEADEEELEQKIRETA
jgi:hypothetical protein